MVGSEEIIVMLHYPPTNGKHESWVHNPLQKFNVKPVLMLIFIRINSRGHPREKWG